MIAQLSPDYVRAEPGILRDRLLSYFLFEGRPLTARGRWINPLVLAAWRLSFALPFRAAPAAPVMIMGQGRSGTTLLGRVLGLHPDLCFLNEPKALWHAATGQDDLIGTYSKTPGCYRMGSEAATPTVTRHLRRAYRTVSMLSRRPRVLDKYPELLFRFGLVKSVFPDAKRLILIRDPYQIAGSVAAWSAANGTAQDDWWGRHGRKWRLLCEEVLRPDPDFAPLARRLHLITRAEDRAALEWAATAKEALSLARTDPKHNLLLRFEDVADAPAAHIDRITAFCGLASSASMREFAVKAIRPPELYPTPKLDPDIIAIIEPIKAALDHNQTGTARS